MVRARDNYRVTGNTVFELTNSLNFLLQRLADRMDRIEGIRGTASIESPLDMNSNPLTEVGGGDADDDGARLGDIATTVAGYTITAGDGLSGGGSIGSSPTLNVGAGTGITVGADTVGLSNMAQSTIKGRASGAGTGDPTDLSAAQVKTLLALAITDLSDVTQGGTFTITATGMDASVTGTARYEIHGKIVVLYFPALSGTSNAATFTLTGAPAAIQPARNQGNAPCFVQDNGTAELATMQMATTGTITLSRVTGGASGWTNSGTKLIAATNYIYSLS